MSGSFGRCGSRPASALRWCVLALALVSSSAVSACGTGQPRTVASVQGAEISRATLAHWTEVEQAEMSGSAGGSAGEETAQQKALSFLITAAWLQQEAAALGVTVSAAEVGATYRRLLGTPAGTSLANSLRHRHMSNSDELLELRLAALSVKLRARVVADYPMTSARIARYYRAHEGRFRNQRPAAAAAAIREILSRGEAERRTTAFISAYRAHWKQLTACQPGYVIAECRNGPRLPPPSSPTPSAR
jgi:SurA-like N-terminal domain